MRGDGVGPWFTALATVVAFVGACSSPSHRNVAHTTTATGAPGSGPTVRVGVAEEPASLNPFDPRSRTLAGTAILSAVLPQLFRVDPDGGVHGSLVDDATVHEAPTRVTFALRKGVRWSDGVALSVEDLRFTLDTVRSDAWPGSRAGYDRISALEGLDRTVTLTFSGPLPGWRRLFSGDDFVLPAHRLRGQPLATTWSGGPDVAGGPLRLSGVTPGLSVTLDRNEQWWGGSVAVGRVMMLVVPDVRTMEQLLDHRTLDVAWPPAGTNRTGRFRALTGVTVAVAPAGGTLTSLVANSEKLSPPRRRALLQLVERDRFVAGLMADEAERSASWSRPGTTSGPWTTVAADPTAAAPALHEQFTAVLAAADDDPMATLLGRSMQSRLGSALAQIDLEFTDASEVDGTWIRDGRFDLALAHEVQWPYACRRCRFGGDAVGRGNWARARSLDDLASAADGGDQRASNALESKLHDDGVLLPMWRPRALVASRAVRGVDANSWSAGPLWDVERWVPTG